MPLYALDGIAPVVHPTAYVHPDATPLVGAGALVAEGTVVPPDHRALGLPARVRPGAGIAEHMDYAVAVYVENAARYRNGLIRVD